MVAEYLIKGFTYSLAPLLAILSEPLQQEPRSNTIRRVKSLSKH